MRAPGPTVQKDLLWVICGQGAAFAGAFLTVKVLTSTMGLENFGLFSLGLTVVGAMHMFVYGPIGNAVSRYVPIYLERGRLEVLLRVLVEGLSGLSILILIFTCALGAFIREMLGVEAALLYVVASIYGIVSGVYGDLFFLLNGLSQRKAVALYQGLDAWLRLTIAICMLALIGNTSYVPLIGFAAGTLFVAISQMRTVVGQDVAHWTSQHHISVPEKRSCYRELISYGTPFVVFAGLGIVSSYSDRWVLQSIYGEGTVGAYAAIYQLANAPLVVLFGALNQFVTPIVFRRVESTDEGVTPINPGRIYRRSLVAASVMAALMTVISFFFSERLVMLFTSKEFAQYHSILWILVLALAVANFAQVLSIKGYLQNKPGVYAWPRATFAVASLVLGIPLAQNLHVYGMAYAVLISSLLYLGFVVIVNSRLSWVSRVV